MWANTAIGLRERIHNLTPYSGCSRVLVLLVQLHAPWLYIAGCVIPCSFIVVRLIFVVPVLLGA